jgi:hypothetical protein
MRSLDDSRIGFLLSLAALPLAACPSDDSDATASATEDTGDDDDADDDDDDDDSTMSASMTDPDSSSSGPSTMTDPTEDTGPDPTESTGPDPTESTGPDRTTSTDSGSESGSSSETGLMTVSESDSESDTEMSGTTGVEDLCPEDIEIPEQCVPYGTTIADCFYEGMYADYFSFYCACNVSFYAAMDNPGCAAAFEEFQACIGSNDCDTINAGECSEEMAAVDEECEFVMIES